MIEIVIMPATMHEAGRLTADGHAMTGEPGRDLICAAVTALVDGLAANLQECWDVHTVRRASSGHVLLTWAKSDRAGRGLRRANDAAGFAYTALKALAEAYPRAVRVVRRKPAYLRRENGGNKQ